jgi:GNAT superfamily N-acetyltransferase
MSRSSVTIKELERGDRDRAARFVRSMMTLTMVESGRRSFSKDSLAHLISTAVHTLDQAIRDPNHYCLLALKDDEIVGIALGQVLGGVGRIDWMAVEPEQRRRGIGKQLMGAVEGYMIGRGCHKMTLQAYNSHMPALGLYLNWGMVPEAALKQHLWGDDYVVMSKWLEKRRRRRG